MAVIRSFFPKKDARIGKQDFPEGQSRAEGRAAKAPDGVGIQNAKEKAAKGSQTRSAPPCSVIHPGGYAHVTRTQRFHRPPGRQSRSGYGIRRFRRHFHRRGINILRKMKELNPNGKLVFMHEGRPLTTDTFNRRLKKYCGELGITYLSSHKIRFTNASMLFDAGVKAIDIQPLLGHSNLAMTQHYIGQRTTERDSTEMARILA